MWNKVVVTGAAGFIGGHLCKRLKTEGVKSIVGIDSLRSGDWSRTPESVERVNRDIVDIPAAEWVELLEGADVLFHLAAEKYNSSKSTPEKLMVANVIATEQLFRAAATINVPRTVFTSSLYAYGSLGPDSMNESDVAEPITLYGASKLMGEGMLRSLDREIGMSWNVARLFFIYGPNQHAEGGYKSVILTNFERILNGESPVIFGDGRQSLDYVYIDDCIEGLMKLATSDRDREIVNLSNGIEQSVVDLTRMMIEVSGASISAVYGPSDWTAGSRRVGIPDHAIRAFNWQPKISMIEGLNNVYQWMKQGQNVST